MSAALVYRLGLYPDTWASCAAIIAENDPLQEGTDGLLGADLLCVGYQDDVPAGFIAGFSQRVTDDVAVAVCSFVRVAKVWFGSRRLVRALFEKWAQAVSERGIDMIVAGVPKEPPTYRRVVEIMLREAGFECYKEDADGRDWFRVAVSSTKEPPRGLLQRT